MARVAYSMAVASELVRAEIVDAGAFRAFSRKYKVGAFPKTFLDYGESFIGVEKEQRVLERILAAQ